jgi:hypothetical protein
VRLKRELPDHVSAWCAGAVALLVQGVMMANLYPNAAGGLGHDFGFYLPRMLAAAYSFTSGGLLTVPWFTPSMCAGGFLAAQPVDVTYSLPQLLFLLLPPFDAALACHWLMTAAGLVGLYVALRRRFAVAPWPAMLGAVAFACNEFYFAHMMTGHLNFYAYTLWPWMFLALTGPGVARGAIVAGTLAAVTFWGGGVHILVPMALGLAGALALYAIHHHESAAVLVRRLATATLAAPVALVLIAARLAVAVALIQALPRSGYEINGYGDLGWLLAAVLRSFIVGWDWADQLPELTSGDVAVNIHEWTFDFGPALWAIIAVTVFLLALRGRLRACGQPLAWAVLAVVIAVPLAVNFHTPAWNRILEQVPIVQSSVTLLRWFCAWVPLVAIGAALLLARLPAREARGLAAAGCLLTVGWHAYDIEATYAVSPFRFDVLLEAIDAHRRGAPVPPVRYVYVARDEAGQTRNVIWGDQVMAQGGSNFFCYDSIFGYRQEWLPTEGFRVGDVFLQHEGAFNFRDPACYVWGQANGCRPGARMRIEDRDRLQRFLEYRGLDAHHPPWQQAADATTLLGWAVVIAYLLAGAAGALRRLVAGPDAASARNGSPTAPPAAGPGR